MAGLAGGMAGRYACAVVGFTDGALVARALISRAALSLTPCCATF